MALRDEASAPGLKRSRWTRFKAGMTRRWGWLWNPQAYAGLALGFLLGRALPGSHMAPLGIAFYAAVRGAGFGPAAGLLISGAVVTGVWSVLPFNEALWVALAVGVCHLACSVFRIGVRAASPLGAALVASAAAAIPLFMLEGNVPTVPQVFWTGLTGVLALVFTLGITDTTSGRFYHTGESPVPAIVLLAAALCGMEGLNPVPWVALRDVVAALLVMSFAYAGGLAMGAAAGAVMGIGFLFSVLGDQFGVPGDMTATLGVLAQSRSMAYVVAGVLAGTFRELRKPGVGAAFALGMVTYAMVMVRNASDLLILCYSVGAGLALFLLVPRQWLAGLPVALITVVEPPMEDWEQPDTQSPALTERIRGVSRVLKEVGRTYEQVAVVKASTDLEQGPGRVFEQVTERVCRSCSMYRQCWEKDFYKTYQLYSDLWTQIDEEGPLATQPVPENLEQHCIKPDRVATTLNYLYDLERSRHHWERRLEEGRAVVGDYLKNVTRMLDRFVDEMDHPGARNWAERPPVVRVQSGIARLPKRGSHISGDSYVGKPLGNDRYLMALSDGMGVGGRAALESKQCVTLLHQLLEAGFTPDVAVNTVNSVLLLRSPEESFATVDLTLLDLATGRGEFVKVGAAPSFIKRGTEVTVVKTASVPIGIINQVQVEPEYRNLRAGDIIVMITDGIWDVSKDDVDKERWIWNHLSRETSNDPEEVAESLLARARELMPDAGDDMTVLVARIDSVTGASAVEPRSTRNGSWVPARVAPSFARKQPSPPPKN